MIIGLSLDLALSVYIIMSESGDLIMPFSDCDRPYSPFSHFLMILGLCLDLALSVYIIMSE